MDVIELAKQLISIPSWVDGETDERKIGEFIYSYLRQFSWLKVKKQPVADGRFNVIAKDSYSTQLLLCGHMDTVQPKIGWKTNQFEGIIKNENLYGLGASDMKGNLAAILAALKKVKGTKGLMLLFYIDEEYDFLGTKKFLKEYKNKIKPKLIVSGDGGNLKIGNGCRGLVEIDFVVQGQTGHAARPWSGKNAIEWSYKAISDLKNYLEKYSERELGKTTLNLAFLQGGLNLGQNENDNLILGREGNNIADVTEFVLDIRSASLQVDAKKIVKRVKTFLDKNGLRLAKPKIRHDLKPWITKIREIKPVVSLIKKETPIKYSAADQRGFIDIQMFWEAFNKVPCISFGAGEESLAHQPNEFVRLSELKEAEKVFAKIINQFGK
jgi:succinyl-diaminopimelate desuccinylase